MKVPSKGTFNIEIGRYGDSKNGFGRIGGVASLLYKIKNYCFA